jgi:exodeoxyribonuclease VII large subunit
MVSPARDELLRKVAREIARLQRGMRHRIEVRMQRLDHITRRLVHPGRRLDAQIASIAHFAARLDRGMVQMLARGQWQLAHLVARAARELPPVDHLLSRAAALARQLRGGAVYALTRRQARLDAMTGRLAALDPHAVLARGFSIVRDADGRTVRDAAQLAPGDRLALTFARGGAEARVERTRKT